MAIDFNEHDGKVVSPIKLAHVFLRTNNFAKMNAFYKNFLGAHAAHEVPDTLAFLTYDGEHHRIAIAAIPTINARDPNTCGLEHIAFTFATLDDLLLAYRQRKALGIEPYWCVNHGPTTSIYYRDPDGNSLETQFDNFATVEEANAYLSGPEFAANPIGVEFVPEEMISRIQSGETVDSLIKRPDIGPRSIDSIPGFS